MNKQSLPLRGKKALALLLAVGVMASIGYFGANVAMADSENPMHQTLISRIAEKFNLKESDVEAVFEAVRDEKHEEMKAEREKRLSQAVSDGIITEAQKVAILSKMNANVAERKGNREEMQNFFKEQGIDQTKLRDYLRPEAKGNNRGEGKMLGR